MIPYAKFFASRRVIRCTSAYAASTVIPAPAPAKPAPALLGALRRAYARSSDEHDRGLARKPCTRGLRPLREDVPVRVLERIEGGEPAAGEQTHRAAEPTAEAGTENVAGLQERR